MGDGVGTGVTFGEHLRRWREFRRMSQLDFALEAGVSQKHLSFLETGRAAPTRRMVLRLSDVLNVPLRDRNMLLVSAGFAPIYQARGLSAEALGPAEKAIRMILEGQEPYPAMAIDRHWTIIAANRAFAPLLAALEGPTVEIGRVNLLRLTLHPGGLAPRILNHAEWRDHMLRRVRHQYAMTADRQLSALVDEVTAYPGPESGPFGQFEPQDIVVPLRLDSAEGPLTFFSASTLFGMAMDITLSEICIESLFPADAATRKAMRRIFAGAGRSSAEAE